MMARKLSVIAEYASFVVIVALASFHSSVLRADGDVEVSKPSGVTGNPFVSTELNPRIVAEEPQDSTRSATTYQNPFANASKAPPIDKSLRSGPVSRWQFPVMTASQPSAVRAAVLNQPSLPPLKPFVVSHAAWDQLPPSENLRIHAVTGTPALSYLTDPDPIIHTTPGPIAQPDSIVSNSADSSASSYQPPVLPAQSATQSALNPPAASIPIPTVPPSAENMVGVDVLHDETASATQTGADDLSSIIYGTDESAEDW